MRLVNYVSHISKDFFRDESGSSLIENILLGALIAVVFILLLMALNKDS